MTGMKPRLARFWGRVGRLAGGLRAPVLCYHSINATANADCDPLQPELFDRHLAHLKANYDVITVDQFIAGLVVGGVLPPRPVVITFDDGYRDNYEQAFPLLRRYGLPATIYLTTGFIDGRMRLIPEEGWEPLSWGRIAEMSDSGLITFAAHTRSHRNLSELDEHVMRDEIIGSKIDIEKKLGRAVTTFAYPNGQGPDIPAAAIDIVQSGFSGAFSTFWRTTHRPSQVWQLNRVMIARDDDEAVLESKLSGAYDYLYFVHKARAWRSAVFGKVVPQ